MNKIYNFALVALALFISACRASERTTAPAVVTFETPLAEIVGGVRLEPAEHRWDGYGEAVDVYGDVLVVGASEWNPCGHGSAYVYRVSGGDWSVEAQLTADDQVEFMKQARQFEGQRFGTAVAVGQGIIAVGAPGNVLPAAGGHSGAVYLYEHDGLAWGQTEKLTPDFLEPNPTRPRLDPSVCGRLRPRSFGALLALDGDTLAVGGDDGGLVYVYERTEDGWQERERILVPGSRGRDLYMASIGLFGDTLALSAFYVLPQHEEEALVLTGKVVVYVFEQIGGTWQETLRFAPEGEADILFLPEVNVGASVALGGESGQATLLAIGLPGYPDWSGVQDHGSLFGGVPTEQKPEFPPSKRQTGAVYLFEQTDNGWRQGVTLAPTGSENPPGPGPLFFDVPQPPDEAQETVGQEGFFVSAGFLESAVFPGHLFSEAPETSFFGATVDLDGDQLAVTAGFANATYVFEHQDGDWVYRFSVKPGQEKIELWEDSAQVVRISGQTLLLGTPSEFGNSAYVFSLDTGN
jgi:hypothetical protein